MARISSGPIIYDRDITEPGDGGAFGGLFFSYSVRTLIIYHYGAPVLHPNNQEDGRDRPGMYQENYAGPTNSRALDGRGNANTRPPAETIFPLAWKTSRAFLRWRLSELTREAAEYAALQDAALAGDKDAEREWEHTMAEALIGGGFAGTIEKVTGRFVAARTGVQTFGGLSRVAEFGIKPYGQLTGALRGTGLQAHHLIEQRFAALMGQNARQGLSVAVTQAEHQAFTNVALGDPVRSTQSTGRATQQQLLDAARSTYSNYPEILKAQ